MTRRKRHGGYVRVQVGRKFWFVCPACDIDLPTPKYWQAVDFARLHNYNFEHLGWSPDE